MPRRKAGRRAIGIITVAALLLCQAAWAGMRAPDRLLAAIGQASGVVVPISCHDSSGSDIPGNAAPSPCESAQLPSDDIRFPVCASVALDLLFVLHALPPEPAPLAIQPAHPAGVPPPPRILHCRFRN